MTERNNFYNNAVFWVEVDRISPNPYQPRREFDPERLNDLAESIKQYGVLQPLVVTRKEVQRADGSLYVEYELLAGERRLRAAKLAGLTQVPVLIRAQEDTNKVKLEIAIIENLQREDLNPIDRAKAFKQLADEFNLNHTEIAKKIGKSREYVSNSIRLLSLPEDMQQALINRDISEGHARPLLMLSDKPEEQRTLFREIVVKKMTVRDAERTARSIAKDRARKQDLPPELSELERALTEELGTRVQIEKKEKGGKVRIDFFSEEDLYNLLKIVKTGHQQTHAAMSSAMAAIGGLAGVQPISDQDAEAAQAAPKEAAAPDLSPQPSDSAETSPPIRDSENQHASLQESSVPFADTPSADVATQVPASHTPVQETRSTDTSSMHAPASASSDDADFAPEPDVSPEQTTDTMPAATNPAAHDAPETTARTTQFIAPPETQPKSDRAAFSSGASVQETDTPAPAAQSSLATPAPDRRHIDSEAETKPAAAAVDHAPTPAASEKPQSEPESNRPTDPDDDLYSIRNFTI